MLGVPQIGKPQDQRRDFGAVLAGGSKKPTLESQGEGCSSSGNICADPGEDEEENLALPTAAITTLQQSSKFKNLLTSSGSR